MSSHSTAWRRTTGTRRVKRVIVLDTHVWVWWVHDEKQLNHSQTDAIEASQSDVIGESAISCWEVAKLVERGRLELSRPVEEWLSLALGYPGVHLIELSRDSCCLDAAPWRVPQGPRRSDHRCHRSSESLSTRHVGQQYLRLRACGNDRLERFAK